MRQFHIIVFRMCVLVLHVLKVKVSEKFHVNNTHHVLEPPIPKHENETPEFCRICAEEFEPEWREAGGGSGRGEAQREVAVQAQTDRRKQAQRNGCGVQPSRPRSR